MIDPEFLAGAQPGTASCAPYRMIVGSASQDAAGRVAALHLRPGTPVVQPDAPTAGVIKYAAGCILATEHYGFNGTMALCVDVADVTGIVSSDKHDVPVHGSGWSGFLLAEGRAWPFPRRQVLSRCDLDAGKETPWIPRVR